jgi:hypothetical protein
VKKNGEKFRKETGTSKRSAFARFRNFLPFFSLENASAAFLFGSVSLSAVRKRNEQSNSAASHKVSN